MEVKKIMEGYPDSSILRKIKNWNGKDVWKMIGWIRDAWNMTYGNISIETKNITTSKPMKLTLVTGGWSGNEDIMRAICKNPYFDALYWQKSERGGLHEYKIYEVKENAIKKDA